jgi:hypothetical protein
MKFCVLEVVSALNGWSRKTSLGDVSAESLRRHLENKFGVSLCLDAVTPEDVLKEFVAEHVG